MVIRRQWKKDRRGRGTKHGITPIRESEKILFITRLSNAWRYGAWFYRR